MRRPLPGLFVALLAAIGPVACAGSHAAASAPFVGAAQQAALNVRVRVPAAATGSLALSAYADGAAQPATPAATVQLASNACALAGSERLCTLQTNAPVGLVDVSVRLSGGYEGTAVRQLLPAAGGSVALAFDGSAARWAFTPALLAAPADGAAHEVPFALEARDAQGFVLLHDAPAQPTAVSVSGDMLNQVAIVAQGHGTFAVRYGGQAVGDVTLSAGAPGAAAATAYFASLGVNPASLEIEPGKTATLSASLAHYSGAFSASSGSAACSVTPASAQPSAPGNPVAFSVRLNSGPGCDIEVQAAAAHVPIVIPAKNAISHPGLGVGPSKIQHVVVLFQENRSFDNIFGGLDNNGKPFPGADTVSNPKPGEPTPENHLGQPVAMATGLLEECYDPFHDHGNAVQDDDGGKMNGFDQEGVTQESCAPNPAPTNYVYRTIEYNEVQPYWQMGEQYAISDRMFEPFTSGSYGPHLYLVSGQSAHTVDNPSATPWGCDAPLNTTVPVLSDFNDGETGGVSPCFVVPTLGDVMDQRGVSWRFYAAGTPQHDFGYFWSSYDSFNDIRNGPDWTTNIVNPPAQIITDVQNGTLAAMTWVTPLNATSDHPQDHSNLGPAWIVSVVNAIGQSKFWDSTAIFITWDDWGGWYDHVPPPVTGPASLGLRVPLIIISPYARAGYVSHVTHTTGSILHFAEEAFDLPSLGEEDAREDDFADAFNFAKKPSSFTPFAQSKKMKAEIMRAASASRDGAGDRDNEAKVGD